MPWTVVGKKPGSFFSLPPLPAGRECGGRGGPGVVRGHSGADEAGITEVSGIGVWTGTDRTAPYSVTHVSSLYPFRTFSAVFCASAREPKGPTRTRYMVWPPTSTGERKA